jgi:cobyrinic acid a,c-diamide synthase
MQSERIQKPGVVVSALRGGSGKTILSIGIIAALNRAGKAVAPFKKGPDYIDAGWLALAAGRPCYNLDIFLCSPEQATASYLSHTTSTDIAVIEGNRGLYDGIDIEGTTSTAELAKLLQLPVIVCVDCTKTTRTVAATVCGLNQFDPEVNLAGVILNRVAGPRHEGIIRSSFEHYCGIPVVGALPKLKQQVFPERHMGLVPTPEHVWAQASIEAAADIARDYIDLEMVETISRSCSGTPLKADAPQVTQLRDKQACRVTPPSDRPTIGVIRDSAFQFYYPENIDALEQEGAELVFVSPLNPGGLPPVDAVYIGGGFPETHAGALAANERFRNQLKTMADGGLPVYAECGGLMYLGEEIVIDGRTYPMSGVLPIVFGLSERPQGHGYTVSLVDRPNPFFDVGTEIKGHEFRYSTVMEWRGEDNDMVFATTRGTGFHNHRDGISYKNVLASYTHLHALGMPKWAAAFVRAATTYRSAKR